MNRGVVAGAKQTPVAFPIPPGVVWEYSAPNLPDPAVYGSWVWADGSLVSRSQYPALFDAIGFAHSPTPGTDPGGNQFYLPNRKGKVGVGLDTGQTEFNTLGLTGGNKASTAPHYHDMSAHTHTLGTHYHLMNNHWHGGENHWHGGGSHTHNYDHWHTAYIGAGNVKAWSGFSHEHLNSGGTASEGAAQGATGAGQIPVNVVGTGAGGTGGPSAGTDWVGAWNGSPGLNDGPTRGPTGGSDVPNTPNTGASSAAQTSGNLQPFITLNYIIKV